jgi:hypothetical protein
MVRNFVIVVSSSSSHSEIFDFREPSRKYPRYWIVVVVPLSAGPESANFRWEIYDNLRLRGGVLSKRVAGRRHEASGDVWSRGGAPQSTVSGRTKKCGALSIGQIIINDRFCLQTRLKAQADASSPVNPLKGPEIMHKSSKELYRAVAKQFGITCKMSDQCRCFDCQSHYFDCEYERNEQEKTDGGLGAGTPMFISEVMHGTACAIL